MNKEGLFLYFSLSINKSRLFYKKNFIKGNTVVTTYIVNHSIFWFEVLFIQSFAFSLLIVHLNVSVLYNRKYLQLFYAHSTSMTSMQVLPIVVIQYTKYITWS